MLLCAEPWGHLSGQSMLGRGSVGPSADGYGRSLPLPLVHFCSSASAWNMKSQLRETLPLLGLPVSVVPGRTGESWTSSWVISPWSLMLRGPWKPASSPTLLLVFWNLCVQAFAKPDRGGIMGEKCSRPTSCPLKPQTHMCFCLTLRARWADCCPRHVQLLRLLYYWLISFSRHP